MSERDELVAALDGCLAALDEGVSLESALARYPALATELRPLLVAARAAGAGADPARVPVGAQVSSRSQFLAHANELSASGRGAALAPVAGRGWWSRLRAWLGARPLAGVSPVARAAVTSLVVLAGLSAGAFGAVAASAESLPGDPLYGVKRTVESTELLLAPDDQARTQLQAEFDRRRVGEVQAVVSQHRQVAVDFTGTLISVEGAQGQHWLVSGVMILVGPQVPVEGDPLPGVQVRVQGIAQTDGSVQAERVTVLPPPTDLPVQAPTSTPAPPATGVEPSDRSTQAPSPTAAIPNSPSDTPTPGHADGTSASQTPESTEGGDHGGGQTETPQSTEGGDQGGSQTHTPEPTEGGDQGGSQTHTPQPTEGGDQGGSQTRTPQPTEGGDHGGSQTLTPRPTEGGDHGGGQTQTPQPTEGGDHSGSHTRTPQPTEGGDHGGGGGSPSPSNTSQPDH